MAGRLAAGRKGINRAFQLSLNALNIHSARGVFLVVLDTTVSAIKQTLRHILGAHACEVSTTGSHLLNRCARSLALGGNVGYEGALAREESGRSGGLVGQHTRDSDGDEGRNDSKGTHRKRVKRVQVQGEEGVESNRVVKNGRPAAGLLKQRN